MTLNRTEILSNDDGSYTQIDVPEWGGTVRVKALDSAGLIRLSHILDGKEELKNMDPLTLANIVVMTAVDEDGKFLFDQEGDVEKVAAKNGGVMLRLSTEAMKINRTEEAEKNSDPDPS